jgi:uncharacterized protein (DUF952 family)
MLLQSSTLYVLTVVSLALGARELDCFVPRSYRSRKGIIHYTTLAQHMGTAATLVSPPSERLQDPKISSLVFSDDQRMGHSYIFFYPGKAVGGSVRLFPRLLRLVL